MAFSNAPSMDTYSTQKIPLVQSQFSVQPNGSYYGMTNLLPFKDDNGETFSQSRYGIVTKSVLGSVNATTTCRGLYVWEKTPGTVYYYVVVNQSVYTATSLTGPFTAVTTFSTNATTPVRFTEFIDGTNTKQLIAVDGVEGYIFTSDAAGTKIVDADFPSPHVPFPVYMDGYLFLAKAGTADVYNCDLNTPSSWTAGNFISSEVYPDDIQALVKVNNYLLAIGITGSEYFYDAAIPTGSPLARYEGTIIPFGTTHPNTIAILNDTVCLVAHDASGDLGVRIIEGFKHSDIPADSVISQISQASGTTTAAAALRGRFFREYGKLFYAIAKDGTTNSDTLGTLSWQYCFDFETKIWGTLTRGVDTTKSTYGTTGHKTYPIYFSAPRSSLDTGTIVAGVAYNIAFIGVLDATVTGVDSIPLNSTSTSNVWYLSSIYTNSKDFGTMNRKFMSRLGLNYSSRLEATNSNYDGSLIPRLTWVDSASDLVNGTNLQGPVALAGGYYQGTANNDYGIYFPFITQLGRFRERYFLVEAYGGAMFNYIEVDINKGQR